MRKKHLVKSKRNNRSRKYKGGNLDRIEGIIEERDPEDGRRTHVKEMTEGINFAKVSGVYEPVKKITNFMRNNERVAELGYTSGGALKHYLYRSDNDVCFLVFDYTTSINQEPDVYYLRGWMLDAIFNQETEERKERFLVAKRLLEERRLEAAAEERRLEAAAAEFSH
jgi:hypothetical protein